MVSTSSMCAMIKERSKLHCPDMTAAVGVTYAFKQGRDDWGSMKQCRRSVGGKTRRRGSQVDVSGSAGGVGGRQVQGKRGGEGAGKRTCEREGCCRRTSQRRCPTGDMSRERSGS